MVVGSIALFLALPRPFNPRYFFISLCVLAVLIGTGFHLSANIGLNSFFVSNDSSSNNLQKFFLFLGRAALIGVGLGILMLGNTFATYAVESG